MGVIFKNCIPYGGGTGGQCTDYTLDFNAATNELTLSDGSASVQTLWLGASNAAIGIDVSNVLQARAQIYDQTMTYTNNDTDCYVVLLHRHYIADKSVTVSIDGVVVWARTNVVTHPSGKYTEGTDTFFLRKGSTITIAYGTTGYSGAYTVYGVK